MHDSSIVMIQIVKYDVMMTIKEIYGYSLFKYYNNFISLPVHKDVRRVECEGTYRVDIKAEV